MKESYTEHLVNQEYNMASELWYHAEDRLKQCVEYGDSEGALCALCELNDAVIQRFSPILTREELTSTLFGILGGILHFACRDAGLPPAYLTMMILWQRDSHIALLMSPASSEADSGCCSPDHYHTSSYLTDYIPGTGTADRMKETAQAWVLYACSMVQSFSLPECGPLVRRSVSFIQQHLTESISIESLAASLGVTRQYPSSQFHKETGKTPTEYINHERIRLSRFDLRQENYTITQIAMMCGYSDNGHHSPLLKCHTIRLYRRSAVLLSRPSDTQSSLPEYPTLG